MERCSDDIKSILAETTSRHISVSGILERSGSFTRPESLAKNFTGVSDMMVDFVFIEEVQNALEKLTLRVNYGKRCCQQILICFKIANVCNYSNPHPDLFKNCFCIFVIFNLHSWIVCSRVGEVYDTWCVFSALCLPIKFKIYSNLTHFASNFQEMFS